MLKELSVIKQYRWHTQKGSNSAAKSMTCFAIGYVPLNLAIGAISGTKKLASIPKIIRPNKLEAILAKAVSLNIFLPKRRVFSWFLSVILSDWSFSPNFMIKKGRARYKHPNAEKKIWSEVSFVKAKRAAITTTGKIAETAMRFLVCVQNVLLPSLMSSPVNPNIKYSIKLKTSEGIAKHKTKELYDSVNSTIEVGL